MLNQPGSCWLPLAQFRLQPVQSQHCQSGGMIGLSLMMVALAIYKIKKIGDGKPSASISVALVLALGGLSSSKLVSEALAIPIPVPTTCVISDSPPYQSTVSAANGSVVVQSALNQGDVEIVNNASAAQSVKGVTALSISDQILVPLCGTPQCVVGLVVTAGASCFVRNGNNPLHQGKKIPRKSKCKRGTTRSK